MLMIDYILKNKLDGYGGLVFKVDFYMYVYMFMDMKVDMYINI